MCDNLDTLLDECFQHIGSGNKLRINAGMKTLYDYYRPLALSYLHKQFANCLVNDYEEIVNDVFLRIYRTADNLKNIRTPKAWLRMILHNRAIDCANKRKKSIANEHIDIEDTHLEEPIKLSKDTTECIEQVAKQLNDQQQKTLRYLIKGESIKMVAREINRTAGATRVYIYSLRKRLRELKKLIC